MMVTPRSADRAAIRAVTFVARCIGAAMLSCTAADMMGLGHPVWAVVSSLIVSQETVPETRHSFLGRATGTLVGAGMALLFVSLLMPDPGRPLVAMGAAVAICAGVARRWPLIRSCLWTAPMVILTVNAEHSILHTAIQRSGEVLLGGTIGAAIHLLMDHIIVRRLEH